MPPKGKYTDPKLRDKVKQEVQDGDKGGAPGQWSARKAQFMASEYKKQGGGYTTDKEHGQDESQKHLSEWGEEDWQTKEGSGNAKKEDGTQKRYLPKKAWEQMNEQEKEETDDKKQAGSKEGKQFVDNTSEAKTARKKANKEDTKPSGKKNGTGAKAEDKQQGNASNPRRSGRTTNGAGQKRKDTAAKRKDDGQSEDSGVNAEEEGEEEEETPEDNQKPDPPKVGNKRGAPSKEKKDEPNKKRKGNDSTDKPKGTFGSKHDSAEEPAPAATKDRLPSKGQRASWKALPGWVHGEVLEVLTQAKQVDGKSVKASKDDPRIVLKSDNGKTAVHKVTAVHFAD